MRGPLTATVIARAVRTDLPQRLTEIDESLYWSP
jgi:hypothetical protein